MRPAPYEIANASHETGSCPRTYTEYKRQYDKTNPENKVCLSSTQGDIVCGYDNDNYRFGENLIVDRSKLSADLAGRMKG